MRYTARVRTQTNGEPDDQGAITVIATPDPGDLDTEEFWYWVSDETGWSDEDLDQYLAAQQWERIGAWTSNELGATAPVRPMLQDLGP